MHLHCSQFETQSPYSPIYRVLCYTLLCIGANGEISAAESVLHACTSVNPLFCTMSSVLSVVTGKVSASSKQALRAVVARVCTFYTCSVTTCMWPTLDSPFYWPPIAPCTLQNHANLMHNIHVHIYMYENRHLYNLLQAITA